MFSENASNRNGHDMPNDDNLLNKPFKIEQIQSQDINSPLLEYKRNVQSQDGEDGIIERIFSIITPKHKYCVEFGAWNGKHLSNTWNLINNHNWGGALIEGNEQRSQTLINRYQDFETVTCLNRFVGIEGDNTLDNILVEVGAPTDFDFLSIDIDGMDYFIWESLSKFRPSVLVVEFNPTVPNDVVFVQGKSFDIHQGCSLMALIQLAKEKGYELVCSTGVNAFFVERDLFEAFGIEGNAIDSIHQPICDGRIFHGYDSHIYVVGMPQLLWSGGIKVESDDFQVVPKNDRVFPHRR